MAPDEVTKILVALGRLEERMDETHRRLGEVEGKINRLWLAMLIAFSGGGGLAAAIGKGIGWW